MDREIPKKEILRRRLIRAARVVLPTAAVVALGIWGITASLSKSVHIGSLQLSEVEKGDINVTVSAAGTVESAFEEVINSPITSRILEVRHSPGDIVEAGTPLIVLDLHEASVAAEKQNDMLKMKRLELERQLTGDRTAIAELEMQLKVGDMKVRRLEAEYANERYLDSIGSGTTDKVREAEFAFRSAVLEQELLRTRLANEKASRKAAADVAMLDLEIMAKEAGIASRTLGDAEIRSPRRATVTKIADKIGSQVSSGQELVSIADMDHFKVDAEVGDAHGSEVLAGNRVSMRIGKRVMEGSVATVSPMSASGVIRFTVRLDNDSIGQLRPGMRTEVFVSSGVASDVLRIDNGNYYSRPGSYALYVLNASGDALELRTVQLGAASMEHIEVISGLKAGERVVISGMDHFGGARKIDVKKK
ncbi:MAG: HlyD family efflux transporter periplasmic adaptor subunit [Muribaculaceae bacterium]|nr:HlyD family efflux transporter periplasmic adaptor subunit [Muribaculaceae bacterium]